MNVPHRRAVESRQLVSSEPSLAIGHCQLHTVVVDGKCDDVLAIISLCS
jgi:hypothetical protein